MFKTNCVPWFRQEGVEGERKPSLKEQPSYLKEVGVALSRREELLKLKVEAP